MSGKPSKYARALIRHLRVLATPNNERLDYKTAYVEFTYLWEDLEQAREHNQVNDAQVLAIEAVGDCLTEVTYREDRFRLGSEEALRSAPEWEPMREASRAAIKELEG